ncbi:MAG TPA: thymidine phosphorylase [Patescibacteria group bacterium]|nr:thymidine phosphorylase [Patescibacteria group bacterium]
MEEKNLALEAIRKKLVGKKLNYKEIYAIMDEISKDKLGEVLTTYFVASGYSEGFSDDELYYLTRAMVETGERLEFRGIVADKHSIGGVPGARVTLILVPIIAAAGFKIPKSSSRAITTPAGTADAMEVIADVTFTKNEILKIVEKTNACIVWGGSFKIAPADDEIIKIEEPLLFESFDKIVVSVMAKKVAFGATHVVIDLPYGKWVKLHRAEDAAVIKRKFEYIARKFGIKLVTYVHEVKEPAGNGIGPLLETRDSLMVLEQDPNRPIVLENLALDAASELLELCLTDANQEIKEHYKKNYKNTRDWAKDILVSGKALSKMREIIGAQRGKPNIKSSDLKPGSFCSSVTSDFDGKITEVSSKNITVIAKILGAPKIHEAGLNLRKRLGDEVKKGEELFSLYSNTEHSLREAIDSIENFPIYEISR